MTREQMIDVAVRNVMKTRPILRSCNGWIYPQHMREILAEFRKIASAQ